MSLCEKPNIGRVLGTAVASLAVMGTLTGAAAAAGSSASSVAAETPSHTVEDFVHPGADEILAQRGILLGRGDGHIALATCGDNTLIQLRSRNAGEVCFRAVGRVGYLSMRVPSVYLINGGDKNITAKLTAASGQSKTYDVAAGLWKPVGESDTGAEAALMELRIA